MGKVATRAQTKGSVKSARRPRVAKRIQKILRRMYGISLVEERSFNTEITEKEHRGHREALKNRPKGRPLQKRGEMRYNA